jgi:hypothetical protein
MNVNAVATFRNSSGSAGIPAGDVKNPCAALNHVEIQNLPPHGFGAERGLLGAEGGNLVLRLQLVGTGRPHSLARSLNQPWLFVKQPAPNPTDP